MGQRDLQACRRGDAGGDAGHDLDGDAFGAQRIELLAATAEDERIAALEANHRLAGLGALDQQRVDLVLRHAVRALGLADRDQLGLAPRVIEHALADQAIVENHVGGFQRAHRLHGEQLGIAGAGADQQHAAALDLLLRRLLDGGADQRAGLGLVAFEHRLGGGAFEHRLPEFPSRRA